MEKKKAVEAKVVELKTADLVPAEYKGLTIADEAKVLVINDQSSYELAGIVKDGYKEEDKKIVAYFKIPKSTASLNHKHWVAAEKDSRTPYLDAIKIINKGLLGYEDKQEKIRLEKEQKLQDQLEKAEPKKGGMFGFGSAVPDELAPQVADVVVASTVKQTGATIDNWKSEVTDFDLFLQWCISEKRTELLTVDVKAVSAYVKTNKGKVTVPGLRQFNEKYKR